MYKLHYFKKSQTGICADDFKNATEVDTINLKLLLSLSDLQKFRGPLTGKYIGKFALVTMSNNDKYYIDENSFVDLSETLSKVSV
jgi:hypothetical protein